MSRYVDRLVRDALYGLAWEARLMQDTPWYRRTPKWHWQAMERIQSEACRIARGHVDDNDLIG